MFKLFKSTNLLSNKHKVTSLFTLTTQNKQLASNRLEDKATSWSLTEAWKAMVFISSRYGSKWSLARKPRMDAQLCVKIKLLDNQFEFIWMYRKGSSVGFEIRLWSRVTQIQLIKWNWKWKVFVIVHWPSSLT